MKKFEPINEDNIINVKDTIKSIVKDIHILFNRRRYGAGAIIFRTFLLHIAYDWGMNTDVYGTFEKVVDYIIDNLDILDREANNKLSCLREICNNATHDVEEYEVSEEDAHNIWSLVVAIIEWNY